MKTSELEALLTLNAIDCFGSIRTKKILDFFGSAEKALSAKPSELSACGALTPVMSQRLAAIKKSFNAAGELEAARKNNIKILTQKDPEYPSLLKEIYDPPVILYVKGGFEACDLNSVAIVGSRGASFYGLSCAKEFSFTLSRAGITIVSGMARGIDTAAHRAAIDEKGRTIAVLGSGLLNIYPPENEGLFEEICENGAAVSEFPLNTMPLAQNFPVRNRVISGLSRGILVVEASQKSGALITARFALEQSREVFAIPGKVSSATSCGTNDLIKSGAKMVTEAREILAELRFNFVSEEQIPEDGVFMAAELDHRELKIAQLLDDEPKCLDDISLEAGMSVSEVLAVLTHLELKKVVKKISGQSFVKIMKG